MDNTVQTAQQVATIKSVNPATGQVEKEFPVMTDERIEEILQQADAAFRQWKQTPFADRATLLKKVASLMRERKEELAKLCTIEMGKVLNQGVGEVELCAAIFDYYAENGEKFMADAPLETPKGKAFVAYEPLGVLLSVQPWNFPFYQVTRSAAPHIMAGNTYVLKHSSNVPQCADAIDQLFRDAGAPAGVFSNLFIPGSKASELISNPIIKGITFTGSETAGKAIASEAGKVVKKHVLELGGSDPLIVLEDADLETAVKTAAIGRIMNGGQICTSPKRIIVMESVAEQFIQQAKAIYEQLKVGDPLAQDTMLGPVVTAEARDQLLKQVEDTVREGARLVYGGKAIAGLGAFMEPTILTDVKPGMVAYSEEIFGPVLCIYAVKDEAEAVRVANDTKFGLGATVLGKDEERAIRAARQVESGMVFINQVTTSEPELIFGGVKNSGYGRELSREGMLEFVNHKLIRK